MTVKTVDNDKRAYYLNKCKEGVERCKEELNRFAADLLSDPSHAVEWSDELPMTAARLKMNEEIVGAMDGPRSEVSIERVLTFLRGQLQIKCRYLNNRSTSPAKNRLTDCEVAVLATEIEYLERLVK